MATFNVARDNHCYITQGYPWDPHGKSAIYTYQILPSGEQVFDFLGWKGGEIVPEILFYGLLVEGSLGHASLRETVSIFSVPDRVLDDAVDCAYRLAEISHALSLQPRMQIFRIAEFLNQIRSRPPLETIKIASRLYLAARYTEEKNQIEDSRS